MQYDLNHGLVYYLLYAALNRTYVASYVIPLYSINSYISLVHNNYICVAECAKVYYARKQ